MFEDFLMNGKSNNALEESVSNNMMNDDLLLNNILLRDEFVTSIPETTLAGNNSAGSDFATTSENNGAVSGLAVGPTATTNDVKIETNSIVKKNIATQVVSAETQTTIPRDDGFTNLLKTEIKVEDKPVTSKNMMLAELLEKSSEKKEPPILNGALRLGEKGLELISKDEVQRTYTLNEKGSVICSNKKMVSY